MSSFINNLKSDRLLLKSIVCVFVLAVCHWIQFTRSGHMVQPLIRAVCASCYVLVAFFFGRKSWPIVLFVWAMSLVYFNRFCNYTSFIMILIAVGAKKRLLMFYIIAYSSAVLVSLYLYKDSFTHLLIHFFGCYFFYNVYVMVMNKLAPELKPLELLIDEENIIRQLAQGVEIKEIEGFSQNTVFAKLKEARIRNCCERNCQLVERYAKYKLC